MTNPTWNINLSDETAKGLLAATDSESLAQSPEFVRRDGRGRDLRFLVSAGDGTFTDANIDASSLVEVAIGTPDDPPTSGAFTLTFGADTTSSLAFDASASAVQTALNALASITSAGGVTVTKDGGIYIVAFTSVGARSLIVLNKGTLAPAIISTNNVLAVQNGDASTQAVQAVVLQKGYLAYSSDFAPAGAGSIALTVLQAASASDHYTARIAISGTPTAGSWTFAESRAQIVTLYCKTAALTSDGDYIIFYDSAGSVAFWADKSGTATIPSEAAACDRAYKVTITVGHTASQVGAAMETAINAAANGEFTAVNTSGVVVITQDKKGSRTAPSSSSGFGIAQTRAGYSLYGTFPSNATAQTIAAAIGGVYAVSQSGVGSWDITHAEVNFTPTITVDESLTWADAWTGTLNLSTWAMFAEFASSGAASFTTTLEVQVTQPGDAPIKALSTPCEVRADVIVAGNLTTSSPQAFGYFNATVTGYTGGGSTNLDGVATINRAVPQLLAFDHASYGGKVYKLRAGTDAESSPAIIRPDDYNALTNAKVWQAFQ